jgi:hypothetical protein
MSLEEIGYGHQHQHAWGLFVLAKVIVASNEYALPVLSRVGLVAEAPRDMKSPKKGTVHLHA